MKKGGLTMNGLSIFGICTVIISVLVMIWGATLHPINFLDANFMSFVISGLVFITIGLFMITGIPTFVKIVSILVSMAGLMLYIYGFEGMDLILKLMSFVPVVGFAIWLIVKISR